LTRVASVKRRRLGEVLPRYQAQQIQGVARRERRQRLALLVAGLLVVHADAVQTQEAGELEPRACRAESIERLRFGLRIHFDGRDVEDCRGHLRRQETLPDQVVQSELVACELRRGGLDRVGLVEDVSWADRLVRLLGELAARAVGARLLGQHAPLEFGANVLARPLLGLLGDGDRVRAHVGDEPAEGGDAFVELLGDGHGLARAEAKLAAGLLLQRAGGEWRIGMALPLLLLHAGDAPAGTL